MVLIIVIAILALIIIARVVSGGKRARETNLRANLKQMRGAIERFESNTNAYPPELADIMAKDGDAISWDVDGRGLSVDRKGYNGPYLVTSSGELPVDPLTSEADWAYDSKTGEVHSSSTLIGMNGQAYNTW